MSTFLIHKNSELLLFIKDNLIVYNTFDRKQQVIKFAEPLVSVNSLKTRKVLSVQLSKDEKLLAVILDNKQLLVYDKQLKVICNVLTNRSCSSVKFTNENNIVVADKTGDVYLYNLENQDVPILLLGHLSMLLDVVISNCGRYLITCDRDEKIRVSCFPNCYNIMSYCLGHMEFVTNLEINGNVLISASGDGTVRAWNFLNGKQLSIINTNDYIQDKNIVTNFYKEMDEEKVYVQALPIVDLKIYQSSDNVSLLGITLLNYNCIQIYHMKISSSSEINFNFNENIMVESKVLAFSMDSELFILTSNTLFMYSLHDNTYVKVNSYSLSQIYSNCVSLEIEDDHNTSISSLYKRKYDNVQEYLDRKKLRLATSM